MNCEEEIKRNRNDVYGMTDEQLLQSANDLLSNKETLRYVAGLLREHSVNQLESNLATQFKKNLMQGNPNAEVATDTARGLLAANQLGHILSEMAIRGECRIFAEQWKQQKSSNQQ